MVQIKSSYYGLVQQNGPWRSTAQDVAHRKSGNPSWMGGGVGAGGLGHAGNANWMVVMDPVNLSLMPDRLPTKNSAYADPIKSIVVEREVDREAQMHPARRRMLFAEGIGQTAHPRILAPGGPRQTSQPGVGSMPAPPQIPVAPPGAEDLADMLVDEEKYFQDSAAQTELEVNTKQLQTPAEWLPSDLEGPPLSMPSTSDANTQTIKYLKDSETQSIVENREVSTQYETQGPQEMEWEMTKTFGDTSTQTEEAATPMEIEIMKTHAETQTDRTVQNMITAYENRANQNAKTNTDKLITGNTTERKTIGGGPSKKQGAGTGGGPPVVDTDKSSKNQGQSKSKSQPTASTGPAFNEPSSSKEQKNQQKQKEESETFGKQKKPKEPSSRKGKEKEMPKEETKGKGPEQGPSKGKGPEQGPSKDKGKGPETPDAEMLFAESEDVSPESIAAATRACESMTTVELARCLRRARDQLQAMRAKANKLKVVAGGKGGSTKGESSRAIRMMKRWDKKIERQQKIRDRLDKELTRRREREKEERWAKKSKK